MNEIRIGFLYERQGNAMSILNGQKHDEGDQPPAHEILVAECVLCAVVAWKPKEKTLVNVKATRSCRQS